MAKEMGLGVLEKGDFDVFGPRSVMTPDGFQPRPDLERVVLDLPLDWDADPLGDRNWRFQLQAWRMLGPVWNECYGIDWRGLQSRIMPWILDWYDFHVKRGLNSHFEWQDMAAGLRAQHLALVLYLQLTEKFSLDNESLKVVEELALLHVNKLRNPDFISLGNHGIFQIVGLRLLGIIFKGRPELAGEEAYSGAMLRRLLDEQFTPEGVHTENSPSYHNFSLDAFKRIRPALFPISGDILHEYVSRAEQVAPWFHMPNGELAAIGDTEGKSAPVAILPAPDHVSRSAMGDDVVMRDLSRSGFAIVRSAPSVPASRASMLIVNGQAFSLRHAHADHLGFELFINGRKVFIDSGKYTYNNDAWRSHFLSNRAHNVAGIAGEVFKREETERDGSLLLPVQVKEDGEYLIEGKVTRRGFFSHRRRYSYLAGRRLRIEDSISARDGDVAVLYFHLASDLDVRRASRRFLDILQKGRVVARICFEGSDATTMIRRGLAGKEIQGWSSPRYQEKLPSTVIEFHCAVGIDHMATTIEFTEMPESIEAAVLSAVPPPLTDFRGERFVPELLRIDGCPICGAGSPDKRVVNCPRCQSRRRTRSLSPLVDKIIAPILGNRSGPSGPLLAFSMARAEKSVLNRCFQDVALVPSEILRDDDDSGHGCSYLSQLASGGFSGVFSSLHLDHVRDHEGFLREVYRVLARGAPVFIHISEHRLRDDMSPPQDQGITYSGESFDCLIPADADYSPEISVGRTWLLVAMEMAGFACRHIKIRDGMSGLSVDWFVGVKPYDEEH